MQWPTFEDALFIESSVLKIVRASVGGGGAARVKNDLRFAEGKSGDGGLFEGDDGQRGNVFPSADLLAVFTHSRSVVAISQIGIELKLKKLAGQAIEVALSGFDEFFNA